MFHHHLFAAILQFRVADRIADQAAVLHLLTAPSPTGAARDLWARRLHPAAGQALHSDESGAGAEGEVCEQGPGGEAFGGKADRTAEDHHAHGRDPQRRIWKDFRGYRAPGTR